MCGEDDWTVIKSARTTRTTKITRGSVVSFELSFPPPHPPKNRLPARTHY